MRLTADVISGFSGSLLQKNFDQAVASPECHYEWWEICTGPYPKVAIAAPRKHAKSTAITHTYTLANVLFRERQYVLIVSDTVSQASQFLADIKKELTNNDQLRELFQIREFSKDTEDDVIVDCADGHQFRITARGAEQKLRGLKWDHKRPDLIICDDLENDEIVMNKDRRDKFKRWFYAALLPCMSSGGIVRVVGTILHEDSLLSNLMPRENNKHTRITPLKVWSEAPRQPWKALKYRAHSPDFEHILWPENYTQDWFNQQYEDYAARGITDIYSQEYLNEPIDDSVAYFKREDFISIGQEDRKQNLTYYITADLAISQSEKADYSVFLVAGVDERKFLHIKNVIRSRLDGREIVDTLIMLQKVYEPVAVGIEDMQVSKSIGPFLNEEMLSSGHYLSLVKLKHNGKDKESRTRSIQARMRAQTVKFEKNAEWYSAFEDELLKFPRGRNDDQVDAFAYLGLMLDKLVEAPTKAELDEEEYLDELYNSGLGEEGRSKYTGY